ncbi:MAG: F0F1 ATP synthase subunit epsilon [Microcystis aeruginosa Ma_MB_F_20061100_S20]|uniref:ATP synthase epsilon chain n=1 Tax=Microcystis aeruginosa Ma_MB_F_20061100_S20D TaxID=2486253 RepID=A0A552E9N4_MICAE|nr:MAG: F0F1 ATP synthase subunit epsilon [Microcystis aeruginosa Ma_MB_F_20061100_S20D]TRU41136.1 MAG: F0F1 ATP synthase subunit epsilon [Microcystis aeruginosa Ma_MB_F_20061100_S20]
MTGTMKLLVILPTRILLETEVIKVTAESGSGYFCLLPHHIDFVTAILPGLLSFTTPQEQERFMAVDEGILVKSGFDVRVSTRHAVESADLGCLREAVEKQFQILDEREKRTRVALTKLEANMIRQFIELGGQRGD